MPVLGIETSCDESAIAIYDGDRGLLAHEIYSQIEVHRQYGGVVPELASRDHIRKTLPLIDQCIKDAGLTAAELTGVAYTKGPGLVGALMVGASIGRSLAYGWGVPAVGIHHMEAHLMVVMLEENHPEFPFLALLVSGGHTLLVDVQGLGQYDILGESLDDAVGEAFDKTAKLLGLPYPGGPELSALAEKGDPGRFTFPRPMVNRPGLEFSFSGLKTFAVNTFHKNDDSEQTKADIAHAFEEAVVDTMLIKCKRALKQTRLTRLVMVGGVSANKRLRKQLKDSLDVEVYYPRREYCTDNGAMAAYLGWLRLSTDQTEPLAIRVKPRWPITDLSI